MMFTVKEAKKYVEKHKLESDFADYFLEVDKFKDLVHKRKASKFELLEYMELLENIRRKILLIFTEGNGAFGVDLIVRINLEIAYILNRLLKPKFLIRR